MRNTRARYGFTLIELLVVVAIIVVLISILLPSLSSARSTARTATCGSNQRQLFMGTTYFAQDNDGLLPGSGQYGGEGWSQLIAFGSGVQKDLPQSSLIKFQYLPDYKVYRCPELSVGTVLEESVAPVGWTNKGYHYGVSIFAAGINVSAPNDFTAYWGTKKLNFKMTNAQSPGTAAYSVDLASFHDYTDPTSDPALPVETDELGYIVVRTPHSQGKLVVVGYMDGHIESQKALWRKSDGSDLIKTMKPFGKIP